MEDVVFEGNAASSVGALQVSSLGRATLDGARFAANNGGVGGGAVYVGDALLDCTACVFEGNRADVGAGIYGVAGSDVRIRESRFEGNATTGGGTAVVLFGGTLDLADSAITGNAVGTFGTVELLFESTGVLVGNTFDGNVSAGDAPAVYVATGSSVVVEHSLFTGNVTASAVGASAVKIYAGTASLRGNRFCGNTGVHTVWLDTGGEAGTHEVVGNVFDGNVDASAVYGISGDLQLLDNHFLGGTGGPLVRVETPTVATNNYFGGTPEPWDVVADALLTASHDAYFGVDATLADEPGRVVLDQDPIESWDPTRCDLSVVERLDNGLVDAGTSEIPDPDGSPSDIGAFTGYARALWDLDGDGQTGDLDCYDRDPTRTGPCEVAPVPTPPAPPASRVEVPYGRVCGNGARSGVPLRLLGRR